MDNTQTVKFPEREAVVLATNPATNFLKLVAAASMLCDHVGAVFFPRVWVLRAVGRLAFPLFCYCTYVGALYTRSVKKSLLRLLGTAAAAQLPYMLAFGDRQTLFANWYLPNVIFTLALEVLLLWALRLGGSPLARWAAGLAVAAALLFLPLEYGADVLVLTMLLWLLREQPGLACLLMALYWGVDFFIGPGSGMGFPLGLQGFALFATPLIYRKTRVNPRLPKHLFYWFYPGHLAVLALLRLAFEV